MTDGVDPWDSIDDLLSCIEYRRLPADNAHRALVAEVRRLREELADANHWRKRWSDESTAYAARCEEYFQRYGSLEGNQPPRYSTEAVDALMDVIDCNEDNFDNVSTRLENAAEAVRSSRSPQR